jgi:glycosyltransferase involved in cell wall biosynthesis
MVVDKDGVHDHVARSYRAYRWLRGQPFDVVYFVDSLGCGFHAVLAKHLGLAFEQTALVVGAQSPTSWQAEGNRRLLPYTSRLQTDHIERFAVAHADAVVAPGPQLLDWMHRTGWALPERVFIQPHPFPLDGRRNAPAAGREGPIREIVYFGRLEPRAGLMLFCQALSRLPADTAARIEVTFLGSAPQDADDGPFDAQGHVERSARPWPFKWRIVAGHSREDELAYLDAAGRLAVIPAVADSSPTAVGGCLARRLPFITSRACDIPEMIDAADRDLALFDPTPLALADKIAAVVASGASAPRPALAPSEIDQGWIGLPALAATWKSFPPQVVPAVGGDAPAITVCLVHRNRPDTLAQALDGLRRQTFRQFDVVLVDDGSDDPAALAALDGLVPEFERRGWTLIRQANRYLGAARNAAWRQARGHYVLFHDDDNVAMPHQLETYHRAAEHAGADVLTCATVPFSGLAPPPEHDVSTDAVWLPIGAALAGGAYENVFGDAQALVRREVLEALGGFSEDFGVGHEDWELFARAALAGYRVLTVPAPLFWYRVSEESMLRMRVDDDADHLRSARPYLELLPPQLRPMLWLAISNARRGAPIELLQYQNGLLRTERMELRQRYGELEEKLAEIGSALRDALLEVTASHSMKLTRFLRNLRNRMSGRPIETADLPPASPRADLARLLMTYTSLSWDLAAPLRLVRRLTRR